MDTLLAHNRKIALDECPARGTARATGSVAATYQDGDVIHAYSRRGAVETCSTCAPTSDLLAALDDDERRRRAVEVARTARRTTEDATTAILAALPTETREALKVALDAQVVALLNLSDALRAEGKDEQAVAYSGSRMLAEAFHNSL